MGRIGNHFVGYDAAPAREELFHHGSRGGVEASVNDILLILHFIGFVLGFAGGIGSGVTMRFAGTASAEGAAALRRLPPVFANVSFAGLVLLWLTGLILIWSAFGGPQNLPGLFWLKILFVLILTGLAIAQHMIYARLKSGRAGPELAARLKMLGPASGLSALVALIIAVLVFH